MIIDCTEKIKKEKANLMKEVTDREEIFKAEKNGLERKYQAEM